MKPCRRLHSGPIKAHGNIVKDDAMFVDDVRLGVANMGVSSLLPPYGVRRQSGAATALWLTRRGPQYQSGVALRLPPHSTSANNQRLAGSGEIHSANMA